jgi:asparagine synthase (glutamine-hydrolysing)
MCGVCGYVGDHQPDLLKSMSDVMVHRGPDDSGIWFDEQQQVGLAHRRLSIIDLSREGRQPMANADGSIQICFNGEVYNYKDFYDELRAKGYRFRSTSDTEVLIYLYEEYGIDFLHKLNGMFAIAIWDANKQQLLLARDHAGVKPLYYHLDGEKLYFASEIKALLQVPGMERSINHKTIPTYLTLLWVPGQETMFNNINKIEPGQYLLYREGRHEIVNWFSLDYTTDHSVSEEDWIERVRETFLKATEYQMVSDVPLGAFLSGGLDSSGIVAYMRKSFPEREITCYTMAYEDEAVKMEGLENDLPHAKKVAKHLDVKMKTLMVKPDSTNLLPKMVYHMDEPDGDSTAIVTYIVAKMARDDGTTVLLSGTGGDEVFFGYRSHQAYRLYEKFNSVPRAPMLGMLGASEGLTSRLLGAQNPLPRRLRKFRNALRHTGLERHLNIVDWSNPETRAMLFSDGLVDNIAGRNYTVDSMSRYYDQFQGNGNLNRHTNVLLNTFLASHNFLFNDKCGMATSIETRVPFMDVDLLRLAARIPEKLHLKGNESKYILKKAMEPYLPHSVIYRSKTGFGPPIRGWVLGGMDDVVGEYLSPANVKQRGLFDPAVLAQVIDDNRKQKKDNSYLIFALLSLEIWMKTFIDQPGVEVTL